MPLHCPLNFLADLALASLTLHNLLRSGPSQQIYCERGLLDEEDMSFQEHGDEINPVILWILSSFHHLDTTLQLMPSM